MRVSRSIVLSVLLLVVTVLSGCGGFKGVVTPTLTAISPATVAAGSEGFTLTATGTNFTSGTQILWDGIALSTSVVSNTQLTASITAEQIAAAGSVSIRVMKSDTTTSDSKLLTITGTGSQTFSLTSISPSSVAAGSPDFTLSATGVGFASGDVITLKYKDGEKKIIVTPQTVIVTYVPGDKSELKPGAKIFIAAAAKKDDGTLEAAAISVGRDGIVPPM